MPESKRGQTWLDTFAWNLASDLLWIVLELVGYPFMYLLLRVLTFGRYPAGRLSENAKNALGILGTLLLACGIFGLFMYVNN
jgi:hypothetical protein